MAEKKKSFILYSDIAQTVNKLPDDIAGKLFKIILSYVNDEDPVVEDLLLQIAFEPIKQNLKRDLKEWESTSSFRSKIGKDGGIKSGESRRQKSETKQNEAKLKLASNNEANEPVNVNVNVNDNVSVSVNDNVLLKKETKFNFKENLLKYGFDSKLVDEWMDVRKRKKGVNTETAFNGFLSEVEKVPMLSANAILKICVEKSWAGFDHNWIKNMPQSSQVITYPQHIT